MQIVPIRKEARRPLGFPLMERENVVQRIVLRKRAKFTLKDEERGWEACTLININQNLQGVGVQFHTQRDIKVNSIVIIDLTTGDEVESMSIIGIVRWIKKEEIDLVGGMELIGNINKLRKILPGLSSP